MFASCSPALGSDEIGPFASGGAASRRWELLFEEAKRITLEFPLFSPEEPRCLILVSDFARPELHFRTKSGAMPCHFGLPQSTLARKPKRDVRRGRLCNGLCLDNWREISLSLVTLKLRRFEGIPQARKPRKFENRLLGPTNLFSCTNLCAARQL